MTRRGTSTRTTRGTTSCRAARARPPPTRQYYHARTSAPIAPQLLAAGYDSDDEVDEGWRLRRAEVLLDEFEDVTPPEAPALVDLVVGVVAALEEPRVDRLARALSLIHI